MTRTASSRLLPIIARALAPAGWMLGVPLPVRVVISWHDAPHRPARAQRSSRS